MEGNVQKPCRQLFALDSMEKFASNWKFLHIASSDIGLLEPLRVLI